MREYVAPDGGRWDVEVRTPGASNAMVVFHHADDSTSRLNRYAWHEWEGEEARNVRARLDRAQVLKALTDEDLAMLFRRSMPIATEASAVAVPGTEAPPSGLARVGLD